jgi:hypothetical protein
VDVHEKLDELISLVEDARSMPMSASCIVNRSEVLALLEEIRELLPEEFRHAQLLLDDRDSVVAEGQREAERIIGRAEEERSAMTAETEVVLEAQRHADRIRLEARNEAEAMRREVDDYVDTKLANFEVVLEKTLGAVHRGRDKLRGRSPVGEFDDATGPAGVPAHPLDAAEQG